MDVTLYHWLGFGALVTVLLTLDMTVFHRKSHEPTLRESALWTVFWCGLALAFNGWIWRNWGSDRALEFLNGYIVEWMLSVDNVFVFAVIFKYFRVPLKYQYRVLFWGIMGAIVMRLTFILAGAALLHYAEWIMVVFGAFLIYTGIHLAFKDDDEIDPDHNWLMRLGRRMFKVAHSPHHDHFFVREQGVLCVTPLFLVLLVVESTDVMFAVDSVPAIFGVTDYPFIVFTSNIFAIMGLRALYFLLAGVIDMFRYLNYGLSAVLIFVGVKMIAEYAIKYPQVQSWFGLNWPEGEKLIPPAVSLVIIMGLLTVSILASVVIPPKHFAEEVITHDDAPPPELIVQDDPTDNG